MRELEFIINSNDYAWAHNMKRLLKETCAEVSSRKSKKLTPKEYANLQKRYWNILTRGATELPARPIRPSGKRGRPAQSDAQNLWDRLKSHEQAVITFRKKIRCTIHKQPSRTGSADGKSETEGQRLLSSAPVCRSLLPYIKLPTVHGLSRVQPADRHSICALR